MKWHILYVNHTSQMSGAEASLIELLRSLDRERFDATIALPSEGPLSEAVRELECNVVAFPCQRLKRTRNPFTLARYALGVRRAAAALGEVIRDQAVDLVHSNSTTAHIHARDAARRQGKPCIWHVRDTVPLGWLGPSLYRSASAVVAISEATREVIARDCGADEKCRVIHNGLSIDSIEQRLAESRPREELGLSEATPLAGMVAQLVPWKGHRHFLTAVGLVAEQLPGARFLIVGADLFGDHAEYEAELHQLARELGIEDKVTFTGYRQDALSLINALDVLVLPSENEPFGRVLLEAMACAKPVVAFDSGGPREIVVEQETGYLVPPESAEDLAEAAVRLLLDRPAAREMGEKGKQRLRDEFSGQKHAEEIEKLYLELLPAK